MKLIHFMLFTVLLASARAASIRTNENESTEIDPIDSSASAEFSTDELSEETSSKLQRRSILLGSWPNFSLLSSLLPCQPNAYGRRWTHQRNPQHNHFRIYHHNPSRQRHGQHNHRRYPYRHRFNNYQPTVTTPFKPYSEITTLKTTRGRLIQTTPIPTTELPKTSTTTTTTSAPDIFTVSPVTLPSNDPVTSRYNDPDNELIYDIDLRFRV